MWDERLVNILSKYIQQLEFIYLCDNFHKELTKPRDFLSQYECTLYQEYEIMHEHKKDINNFISRVTGLNIVNKRRANSCNF